MASSRPVWLFVHAALLLSAGCATTNRAVSQETTSLAPFSAGAPVSVRELVERHEATVFVWWSSTCPCAGRYEKRVLDLRARHPEKQLGVYAIVSNADETMDEARAEALRRGFDIPMYFDAGHAVADTFRIRSTPTVVLFDRRGDVRFTGWIDNEREPGERGREPWLDDAVTAVLAGRHDFQNKTPVWGCPLTRSLFDDVPDCCRRPAASQEASQ